MALRTSLTGSRFLRTAGSVSHGIGTGDFTVSAWAKIGAADEESGYRGIFSCGATYAPGFTLRNLELWVLFNSGGFAETGTGYSVSQDAWHHIVFVRSGSDLLAYADGTLRQTISTALATKNFADGTFQIGSYSNAGGAYFDGYIEDVAVWSSALTGPQISAMYTNKYTAGWYSPNIGYWRLNGTSGTVTNSDDGVMDLAGSNNMNVVVGQECSWSSESPVLVPVMSEWRVNTPNTFPFSNGDSLILNQKGYVTE